MTTQSELAPPEGINSLSPHLIIDGAAAAIDFYKAAFGATEIMRLEGPGGKLMHGRVQINGASVLLVDANPDYGMPSPKGLGGTPVTLHLVVPDVDAFAARAAEAGGTLACPPTDMFWGDRYAVVVDPFGHSWSIATPLPNAPKTMDELRAAASAAMGGAPVDA